MPALPGTLCAELNAFPDGKNPAPKLPGICGLLGGLGFSIVSVSPLFSVLFFGLTNLREFLSKLFFPDFSNDINS